MKIDPKLHEKLGELFAAPIGEKELPGALLLNVEHIQTAAQPRQYFDEGALKDLENSIRELHTTGKGIGGTGILQPLLVRSGSSEGINGTKEYIVTAGERRLRAAKAAGLTQVPVVIDEISTDEAWEHAIIENLLRADLAPLEEAHALHKLMQSRGYSVREAAKRLGKDKGYLENRLFLLKTSDDVQEMVSARADTIRHAREISKIDEVSIRQKLIEATLDGASFTHIQARVQKLLAPKEKSDKEKTAKASSEQGSDDSFPHEHREVLEMLNDIVLRIAQVSPKLPADDVLRAQFAGELRDKIAALAKLANDAEGIR